MACLFGCCSMKTRKQNKAGDDFAAVDKFLVDYAIKYQLYTPPSCKLLRNRLAYVVQWRHLRRKSELVDFKIIPQDGMNSNLLANVGKFMNNNGNNNTGVENKPEDAAKGHEPHAAKAANTGPSRDVIVMSDQAVVRTTESVSDKLTNVALDLKRKVTTKKQTKSVTVDSLEIEDDEGPHEENGKRGQIDIRKYRHMEKDETSLIGEKPEPRELSLFKTEYTNSSGATQKFTFQTERRTTSSIQVNVQKSLTIGGQLDLSFALPIETASLSGEYQVSKSRDETIEKEQVWTVNNEVEVNAGEKVIAEMKVMEEEVLAMFRIKHTISMMPLSKHIIVHVVKKSQLKKHPDERKVLDVFSLKDHNLHKAFLTEEAKRVGIRAHKERNAIEFESEGVMTCVYQSKQVIDVRLDDTHNVKDNGGISGKTSMAEVTAQKKVDTVASSGNSTEMVRHSTQENKVDGRITECDVTRPEDIVSLNEFGFSTTTQSKGQTNNSFEHENDS